ncbi:MAG: DMT family transporter [Sphingomonadaceae bacterium]
MIGELSGLGCAAAWAVISTVMRSLSEKISPVVVNGLRCGFATITLVLLVVLLGHAGAVARLPLAGVAAILASGVLGQTVGDAVFVRSMKLLGASRAMPISSINPMLTLILAVAFLGEPLTWGAAGGTLLVICGVYLLAFPYNPLAHGAHPRGPSEKLGLMLALLAATCWSLSTILLRVGLASVDIFVANAVRMGTATVLLLGLDTFQSHGRIPVGLSRRSLVVVGMAGVLSAFSSLMFLTAVHYAGAAKAATLSSTAPLFGLPLSIFFLREKFSRRIVLGTLLAVFGIWLVVGG